MWRVSVREGNSDTGVCIERKKQRGRERVNENQRDKERGVKRDRESIVFYPKVNEPVLPSCCATEQEQLVIGRMALFF